MTVGASTAGMRSQRTTYSDTKHRAFRAAVERQVARAQVAGVAAVARAAEVTESFVYRHEATPCALCVEHFGVGPASYHRLQMLAITAAAGLAVEREAQSSVAALRADLANSKATVQRLAKQVATLERRLGEVLGSAEQAAAGSAIAPAAGADDSRVADLEAEVQRLTRLCSEKDEELDAVRRINAELTRRQNQNRVSARDNG